MAPTRKYGRPAALALAAAAILGLAPAALSVVVDPYRLHGLFDLGMDRARISEKAHYPLWKVIQFNRSGGDTIILGDSRARALRTKLWRELGYGGAFNFAYGGATVHEIYDTFRYVTERTAPRRLVVGIQLRSFDPDHKGGMNRVPEAIRLASSPLDYYKSWFVARIGWRNLYARHRDLFDTLSAPSRAIASDAKAAEFGAPGTAPVSQLLQPDICFSCKLPDVNGSIPYVRRFRHHGVWGRGHGRWAGLWADIEIARPLPAKMARQVKKNGSADWKKFRFSEELWSKIAEIARWSREHKVPLVFVIPPTIPEMQNRIAAYGHGELNHRFRERLAGLAPVIDLDFDNPFTRNIKNFSDAYHFGPKAAKAIVGEIVQVLADNEKGVKRAVKRRVADLKCPAREKDVTRRIDDGIVRMTQGVNCRIWSRSND